jgi:hypothetical protein
LLLAVAGLDVSNYGTIFTPAHEKPSMSGIGKPSPFLARKNGHKYRKCRSCLPRRLVSPESDAGGSQTKAGRSWKILSMDF